MWPFQKRRRDAPATGIHAPKLDAGLWSPRGDHELTGSEAVFSAVTILSSTLASMRCHLYKGHEIAKAHPLERLVSYQPSPRMDRFSFWQSMEACLDTAGNCYALKVRDDHYNVVALDVLEPDRVEVRRDLDTGDVWYLLHPKDGGTWYVSGREMLHCRHVCAGGEKGVSPIAVLRDALDYNDQMQTFSVEQVKGVTGAVVLEVPAQLSDERVKGMIDGFMENYRRSSGGLIVLTGGMKSNVINRSPVDARVLDVEAITAGKVARVYSLPPVMLGVTQSGTYANQEQRQMDFLTRTMLPKVRMYEAQMDLKLLTWNEMQEGYRFGFELSDLLVADQKSRAEMCQALVRNGVWTPNEARKSYGLPPDVNGNSLMSSRDLSPLSYLVAHPESK